METQTRALTKIDVVVSDFASLLCYWQSLLHAMAPVLQLHEVERSSEKSPQGVLLTALYLAARMRRVSNSDITIGVYLAKSLDPAVELIPTIDNLALVI